MATTLMSLNDDCLEHILSLLTIKEKYRLKTVCKRLHVLVESSGHLVNQLEICFDAEGKVEAIKYDMPILCELLRHCGKSLRRLRLDSWGGATFPQEAFKLIFESCPNLRSLDVRDICLSPERILLIAEKLDNLVELHVGMGINGCTEELSWLISKNQKLQSFQYTRCEDLDERFLAKLPLQRISCFGIRSLCNADHRFINGQVLGAIGGMINLKTVFVETAVLPDNFNDLLQEIPEKLKLEKMTMQCTSLIGFNFKNINLFVKLREVTFNGFFIDDYLLRTIAVACEQLVVASFTCYHLCFCSSAGLKIFLKLSRVKSLHLEGFPEVSDDAFDVTVSSLEKFSCINMPLVTNQGLLLILQSSAVLSSITIISCINVDYDILLANASNYIDNRTFNLDLHLEFQDFFSGRKLHRLWPRLIK